MFQGLSHSVPDLFHYKFNLFIHNLRIRKS
jgi:hypothetical protein